MSQPPKTMSFSSASFTKSLIFGTRDSVRLPSRIVPICVSDPTGTDSPRRTNSTPAITVVLTAPMPGVSTPSFPFGGAILIGLRIRSSPDLVRLIGAAIRERLHHAHQRFTRQRDVRNKRIIIRHRRPFCNSRLFAPPRGLCISVSQYPPFRPAVFLRQQAGEMFNACSVSTRIQSLKSFGRVPAVNKSAPGRLAEGGPPHDASIAYRAWQRSQKCFPSQRGKSPAHPL